MAHVLEEVPAALQDPERPPATSFFPPVAMMPTWQPPRVSRGVEDLMCFEPYADGPMSPDPSAARSRPAAGVDPVLALQDHFMYEGDVEARRRFDDCIALEKRLAMSSCETGMFPDGREHPGATLEECVAMWVDGIPDRTNGNATTTGVAHAGGVGAEIGPEEFRVTLGYEQTRSSEETRSQERTQRGVAGTRDECLRDYREHYARKRKMGAP